MTNLLLVGILMPLLALAPVAYAQNTGTNFINNETLNQAKNTSIGLLDQAPGALKSAYSEAKNTSIGLLDRVSNLIKNDTNSSKLLNELEGDVGNLINEFSSFFSR
jgi:hypothetical protein